MTASKPGRHPEQDTCIWSAPVTRLQNAMAPRPRKVGKYLHQHNTRPRRHASMRSWRSTACGCMASPCSHSFGESSPRPLRRANASRVTPRSSRSLRISSGTRADRCFSRSAARSRKSNWHASHRCTGTRARNATADSSDPKSNSQISRMVEMSSPPQMGQDGATSDEVCDRVRCRVFLASGSIFSLP